MICIFCRYPFFGIDAIVIPSLRQCRKLRDTELPITEKDLKCYHCGAEFHIEFNATKLPVLNKKQIEKIMNVAESENKGNYL